jgi:hypothetical protein
MSAKSRASKKRRLKSSKVEPPRSSYWRRFWALAASVCTILGAIAAVVTLLPRVSPSVSDPVDPKDPFTSSVTITNTGFIPLDAVSVQIGIAEICAVGASCSAPDFPDPKIDHEHITRIQRRQWVDHDLGLDERFTIALNDAVRQESANGTVYADLSVIVRYRIPIIGWTREKVFPIYTHQQANGYLYWYTE